VGWDQFQPFVNQPVVLPAIERSGIWKKEDKTVSAQFVRLKEVHQCKNACATLSNFVSGA
jgi:hypothetical protein